MNQSTFSYSDMVKLNRSFQSMTLEPQSLQKVDQVHTDDVHALIKLSPDTFASGSKDTTVAVWDSNLNLVTRQRPSEEKNYENWITALHALSNGEWMSGSRNGIVTFWSQSNELLEQRSAITTTTQHKCKNRNYHRINCIAELPENNGITFLTGLPTAIQKWNFNEKAPSYQTTISPNDWLYCVNALGNERYALIIGSDIDIWKIPQNSNNFEKVSTLYKENKSEVVNKQRPHIASSEFLKDKQLALALFSGHIKVLDTETGTVVASYLEHQGRAWTICKITSDLFASGADDGYLKIWDTRQQKSSHSLGQHSGRVSCTLLQNENTILAASCPNDPHNSNEKASFTQWDLRKY